MPPTMARRSKLSAGLQQALCAVLSGGATRRAACAHVGIDHSQFYRWLQRSATFRDAIQKAESDAELRFTTIVAQAATETWQAAAWWLERRRPDDFGRRDRLELDVRREAERLAAELGLDPAELIAQAERIIGRQT